MAFGSGATDFAGELTREPVDHLVCFAVKEEAAYFLPARSRSDAIQVRITGMGRRNAAEGIRHAVTRMDPDCVLTCGFAGGLNPALSLGTVIFDQDFDAGVSERLMELGAVSGRFHCSKRVAVTVAEKRVLWESTGADAVEMESSVIRTICRELRIPSATIRVISDTAHDDLPLDFNALMTSNDRIDFVKLGLALLRSPRRIPQLISFQRQTIVAARRLGEVLQGLLKVPGRI
jgi:adenosylhomocysteine nucleosidase